MHDADVAQAVIRAIGDTASAGAERAAPARSRTYNVADLAPVSTVELYQLTGAPAPDR